MIPGPPEEAGWYLLECVDYNGETPSWVIGEMVDISEEYPRFVIMGRHGGNGPRSHPEMGQVVGHLPARELNPVLRRRIAVSRVVRAWSFEHWGRRMQTALALAEDAREVCKDLGQEDLIGYIPEFGVVQFLMDVPIVLGTLRVKWDNWRGPQEGALCIIDSTVQATRTVDNHVGRNQGMCSRGDSIDKVVEWLEKGEAFIGNEWVSSPTKEQILSEVAPCTTPST